MTQYIRRKVDNAGAAASALAGGVSAGLFPGFIAQYLQRLAGGAQELGKLVGNWRERAGMFCQGNLQKLIEVFQSNPDPIINSEGQLIAETTRRYEFLTEAANALRDANIIEKPMAFVRYFDREMFSGALGDFLKNPTIAVDLEGLAYITAGAAIAWGVYEGAKYVGKRTYNYARQKISDYRARRAQENKT